MVIRRATCGHSRITVYPCTAPVGITRRIGVVSIIRVHPHGVYMWVITRGQAGTLVSAGAMAFSA